MWFDQICFPPLRKV